MKLLAALFLIGTSAFAAAPPLVTRAGAYAQDITPTKLPSPINGGLKGNFASTRACSRSMTAAQRSSSASSTRA
jgi:hypothetical protein